MLRGFRAGKVPLMARFPYRQGIFHEVALFCFLTDHAVCACCVTGNARWSRFSAEQRAAAVSGPAANTRPIPTSKSCRIQRGTFVNGSNPQGSGSKAKTNKEIQPTR